LLRGFYSQTTEEILRVFDHLLAMPMVRVEDESAVAATVEAYRNGLDFADALHHASENGCSEFLTFDDRGFARPALKLKLQPIVVLPAV